MNVLGRHGPNSLNSPGGAVIAARHFFAGSLKQEDDMPKYLKPKPMKQKPVKNPKPKKGKKAR